MPTRSLRALVAAATFISILPGTSTTSSATPQPTVAGTPQMISDPADGPLATPAQTLPNEYGSGGLVSISPARLADTRAGQFTVDGTVEGGGPQAAGTVLEVPVIGRGGVPGENVEAVFLNVTAVSPEAPGYLTVFNCDGTPPEASNVNYMAGQIAANAALARVSSDGRVCIFTLATTDIVVDVNGWSPDTSGVMLAGPARFAETRVGQVTVDGVVEGVGRQAAGTVLEVPVLGRGDVPVGPVEAVFLNVTAVSPDAPGYLTVFPCGTTPPNSSNVNYFAGQFVANAVLAKVGDDGKVCIFTLADTDIVVDANGWSASGTGTTALAPARFADTRVDGSADTVDGEMQASGAQRAGSILEIPILGRGDVPADKVDSVMLNVTVVNPDAPGFLTVFPCGTTPPQASNVNYMSGQVVANAALAKIGDDGKVCVFTLASADIVVDVNGWFATAQTN